MQIFTSQIYTHSHQGQGENKEFQLFWKRVTISLWQKNNVFRETYGRFLSSCLHWNATTNLRSNLTAWYSRWLLYIVYLLKEKKSQKVNCTTNVHLYLCNSAGKCVGVLILTALFSYFFVRSKTEQTFIL